MKACPYSYSFDGFGLGEIGEVEVFGNVEGGSFVLQHAHEDD